MWFIGDRKECLTLQHGRININIWIFCFCFSPGYAEITLNVILYVAIMRTYAISLISASSNVDSRITVGLSVLKERFHRIAFVLHKVRIFGSWTLLRDSSLPTSKRRISGLPWRYLTCLYYSQIWRRYQRFPEYIFAHGIAKKGLIRLFALAYAYDPPSRPLSTFEISIFLPRASAKFASGCESGTCART